MKPTPEIEIKGLKAYEQVRAFERLRTWRLPLIYTFFPVLLAGFSAAMWVRGVVTPALADLLIAVVLVIMFRFQWKNLLVRYAANLKLLHELEAEYGDELPWVQVEKHFAALDALKREIAEGRVPE